MALPVDELQRELTAAEIEASLYRLEAALGLKTTSWRPGGVVRTLNKAMSFLFAGFAKLVTTLNAAAFSDTAVGAWLDRRVHDTCGDDVTRDPATFARNPVVVDNAGGGNYNFAARRFTVKNGATGKTYTNVDPLVIAPLQTGVSVVFEATERGAASTAAPGAIDTVVTTALGLSVSNPTTLIGTDAEEDPAYRATARESFGRLSPNGPRDAYAFAVKGVKRVDGTTIAVNRVKVSEAGIPVNVYVASPAGTVAGDLVTPGTDLYLLQQNVDANVVPNGVEAVLHSATPNAIDVTATLYIQRSAGLGGVAATAAALKLARYFKTLPIGGQQVNPFGSFYVFKNAIVGVLEALEVSGVPNAAEAVIQADVSAPANDVAIASTEVPTLGVVTLAVVEI